MKRRTNHKSTSTYAFEPLEARELFTVIPVTSALDSGPNTLRAAINAVNHDTSGASDSIVFNLNNHNAQQQQIITLFSPLNITRPVTIDGTTQNPAFEYVVSIVGAGLVVTAGNTTIRGLSINALSSEGVDITLQNGGNDTVQGCYLTVPSVGTGVLINNSSNDVIGLPYGPNYPDTGMDPPQFNDFVGSGGGAGVNIAGNSAGTEVDYNTVNHCYNGIVVGAGATSTMILTNLVGDNSSDGILDRGSVSNISYNRPIYNHGDGIRELGNWSLIWANQASWNQENGIEVGPTGKHIPPAGSDVLTGVYRNTIEFNRQNGVAVESNNNQIGGFTYGNTIDNNGGAGVLVTNDAHAVGVSANSIFSNTGLGIDLEQNANRHAPTPTITSALASNGQIVVSGVYIGTPNSTVFIECFLSATGTHSDGRTLLGYPQSMQTDAHGVAEFTLPFSTAANRGVVTATATDYSVGTSPFSLAVNVTVPVVKGPPPPPRRIGLSHMA